MTSRMHIGALAALLAGCVSLPGGTRPAVASELDAVAAIRSQYVIDGIEAGQCRQLDAVMVYESAQTDVRRECDGRPGTVGCVRVVQRHPFDVSGATVMLLTRGVGWRTHHSLVIHEANHVMNDCAHLRGSREHSNETWRGWAPGEMGTEGRAFERWDSTHPIPSPDPYAAQ